MDPIAGADIERKKRREFSGSDSGEGYFVRLKKYYTSRIRHAEKLLPIVSKIWLYSVLRVITKYFEYIVKSIDLMFELQLKLGEIRVQNIGRDLELNEQFKKYRKKFYDLEREVFQTDHIVSLVKIIRKDNNIVKSILNTPIQLEGILPPITEQWLKDIFLDIRGNLLKRTLTTVKSALSFLDNLKWYEVRIIDGKRDVPIAKKGKDNRNDKEYDHVFKIIFFGEPQAAKTTLLYKFLTNKYSKIKNTPGFEVKSMELNDKKIKLQIWDFNKQKGLFEKPLHFLIPTSFRGADGVIIMYDFIKVSKLFNTIDRVSRDAGDIPILLGFTEILSEGGELVDSSGRYTFTEITKEVGSSGEQVFKHLAKKMIELSDNFFKKMKVRK